jgi:threonine/homoserine/homoserine lactone efflux protein
MEILAFLAQVFVISLSGALQPGPVTTAAITMGTRNRLAGSLIAIGHGIVEFPLMVLIVLGLGRLLELTPVQIVIGIVGGLVLVFMAVHMWGSLKTAGNEEVKVVQSRPVLAGIVLTASNPYFLFWWATIGLALATKASGFGVLAFALFAVVHWLVDLGWVTCLSWASFGGSTLMTRRNQRSILAGCAAAMLLFGIKFVFDSVCSWYELTHLQHFSSRFS